MLGLALTAAAAAAAGYQSMAPTGQWYGRTFTGLGRGANRVARKLGLEPVMWSITGYDWNAPPAEQIEGKVSKQVRGGDVILLHDGSHRAFGADRAQTVIATDRLIARYKSEGYEFMTIPEMMVPSQRKDWATSDTGIGP